MATICECSDCQPFRGQFKMMRTKCSQPCFGFFLQGSAKETAIANSFVAVASMIIFSAGIVEFMPRFKDETEPYKRCIRPTFWILYYIYWSSEIYMSIILYKASTSRDPKRCQKWLKIQIFCYIIFLIMFIIHSYGHWFKVRFNPILQACFWVICVYKLYTFWVIKSFINQMMNNGKYDWIIRKLSDADLHVIEEFEKGSKHSSTEANDRPYDKDYEIQIEDLNSQSFWVEIGRGQYGTAFKAIYTKNGVSKEVAVKTINCTVDIMYFKAFLSELKIMCFIGEHPNIVNLIGAVTNHILERRLDIIVELCAYGNLLTFLQTRRGLFVNQVDTDQGGPRPFSDVDSIHRLSRSSSCKAVDRVTTVDLIRWSLQTARGLEYLHKRGVIHSDVAARNVLLTMDKVAKISDFGLSKRIYTYRKSYVRDSSAKMLPWQHMSPEQFTTHLLFSREADIWSFGITLQEFFSLGETPYPHILEPTKDFLVQLKTGMARERPNYCPMEVFKIMENCLLVKPEDRPQFSQIIVALESVLNLFHGGNRHHHHRSSIEDTSDQVVQLQTNPLSNNIDRTPYTFFLPVWSTTASQIPTCPHNHMGTIDGGHLSGMVDSGQVVMMPTMMNTLDRCGQSGGPSRNESCVQPYVPLRAPYVSIHV